MAASSTVWVIGPGMVERPGHGEDARLAGAAEGGLHANAAAERGRDADAAAGIGAERAGGEVGGDGRAGTAARTAGDAARVPGVVRRAVVGVVGRRAPGEFVRVGLAEEHGAGLAQLAGGRGIVLGDVIGEDLRAAVVRMPAVS